MSLTRRFSLQFGLTAGVGVAAALAASLAVFGVRIDAMSSGFGDNLEAAVEKQLRRDGEAILAAVAEAAREPLLDYNREALARVARSAASGSFAAAVRIYDNHGRAIADSAADPAAIAGAAPPQLRALGPGDGVARWTEGAALLSGRAICIRGACLGTVAVAVDGSDMARERAALDADLSAAQGDFFRRGLMLGLLALAVITLFAALVGFLLGRRLTQSLQAAIRGLEQLAEGARDVRIDSKDDQLRELTEAVETLAEKLNAARPGGDPIIAELADGLFVAEPDGVIVVANPALHALLKAPEPTLVGADAFGTFALDPAADAHAFAAAMSAVGQVRTLEDDVVPVMVSARVAGAPPDEKVVALVRDNAQLAEAEAAARAAQLRAEAAERAKSQFLSVMSHELRTPLNGVLGGAAVLAGTELDPSQKGFVNIVQNSGRSLLRMIGDLLTLSRVASGEEPPEIGPVDLDAMAHRVADAVAEAAAAKGLELSVRVQPGAPIVLSDLDRLVQIGVQLAENAVKFTDRGKVEITLGYELRDGEAAIAFSVADTGPGVAPEMQERIFERFTQIDGSSTRGHGGAGLGLALTRELADSLGAEVGVESAPGEGATFTVRLTAAVDDSAPALATPALARARAMVVSPSAQERATLSDQLAHAGAETRAVDSAGAAVAAMDAAAGDGRPVNLLVRAADLPGMAESGLADRLTPAAGQKPLASVVCGEEAGLAGAPDYVQGVARHPNAATLLTAAETALAAAAAYEPAADAATVAAGHSPARGADPAPRAEASPGVIVLAEENEVNRIVLSAYLRKAGFVCHTAPNGVEALRLYREIHPAMVLISADLPVMAGADAAREMRRHEAEAGLPEAPIIAMIDPKQDAERERCTAAGMSDHLLKPVKVAELSAKLDRWTVLYGHGEDRAPLAG